MELRGLMPNGQSRERVAILEVVFGVCLSILIPIGVFLIVPFRVLVNGIPYFSQAVFGSIPITAVYLIDLILARTAMELTGFTAFLFGNWIHTVVVVATVFIAWIFIGYVLRGVGRSVVAALLLAVGATILIAVGGLTQFWFGSPSIYRDFAFGSFAMMFSVFFWINLLAFCVTATLGSLVGTIIKEK